MSRAVPLGRWLASTSVLGGMLFLCAGTTRVPMLRAYFVVFAGAGLVTALAADVSQDGERRKPGPEEVHRSSRVTASLLFFATVIIAALDAVRFHWTQPVNSTTQAVALLVLILAAALQVWAMVANRFFSTAIRVQTERGHVLIMRGPYRFIRHPGYLAMAIMMPSTALALGSTIALIPAFCYSALILWRTEREDEFLAKRLDGYTDYAARVRYRLIPRLW